LGGQFNKQILVQRITYFPLVTEQIYKYLIQFVDSPGEMWLEYDGLPIKWFARHAADPDY
jgi:hypothetical protein